ncbi:hyaluronidase-4 isoform X1 [Syngnathoides biaculeatus]|uniref:hyaluronidase-4 isoform X1 n=1 Tax=Syngnathoides biaculeatus TaxID=300417 RepID=UPI002ADD66AB|nr:hyaluronidase-4 isoform X1 [Syngnathoides biaculeatus]XP_061697101.1 hyaluronidase-4 isoform X1 [Syngnathoides biaculeatus]
MPAGPAGAPPSGRPAVPVALFLLLHAALAQKPARPPLVGRRPFVAAWNAPLDVCAIKYNVSVDLDRLFHIRGSPRADWSGQNVTIFYANRLGYYPRYTAQGEAVHGGVPQNGSLDGHLSKAHKDIEHFIPAEDFRGLAVIDWEFWRPQWSRNWHKKDVYRRMSRELTAKAYRNVTAAQVEELARRRFEKSARAFMQRTLQLGTRLRPDGLWGFYLYPDCHNYNLHENDYTGLCPLLESLRNDELRWLWNSSTALYPSVAIRKSHANSVGNLHFARHRVREALRVASLTSNDYDLPTFVYLRLGYRDEPLAFLTTKDLVQTIGESAALGAAGFVIWGDLNLTTSRHNCTKVRWFLSHRLGQYITNVTRAAEFCSDFLCQNNGRCIRRNPGARHYLHLNAATYSIRPAGGDGDFSVSGWHSPRDLQLLRDRFRCHCYEGHRGERCDSANEVREEDDGPPGGGEDDDDDEKERRRAEWEDEQAGQAEEGRSGAPPTLGPAGLLTLSMLLLNFQETLFSLVC